MDFEFQMEQEPFRERRKERPEDYREYTHWPSFHDTSMSKSSGPDLLPKKRPSSDALGPYFDTLVKAYGLEADFSEEEIRIILWTIAIENAFERENYAKEIPGFRTVTYGFFDPETEMDGFGVIAYVAPSLFGRPRGEFQWVTVDDQSFHVIVRPAEWRLHSPTVHPALGTSTCWAESRRPRLKARPAILTAKHVVAQTTIGSAVPLTSGHGTLLDLAPEGIDAALVQVPKPQFPDSLTQLHCQQFIPQWSDVDVICAAGQFSTKVTEVSSGRGTLHPAVPLRIFLANAGQPGNSGALVVDAAGKGIGLYMGEITTPANLQEGFCQHLGQVEESMAVDLFL